MDTSNGDLRREALLFDLAKRAASTSLVADMSSRLDISLYDDARDEHHVGVGQDDDDDADEVTDEHTAE